MEFKIYSNKQEFLSDDFLAESKPSSFNSSIEKYKKFNTKNYAFKFTEGEDRLVILKVEPFDMLLHGAERLAAFAADVIADYHLEVKNLSGEEKLVKAFNEAYQKRLGNLKQALFAGGCFWCMAKPYYEYEGIRRVFSGYAGGDKINPTYEDVKKGVTGHRETVMLEYDNKIISFKQLLDIYFDTIDPFDEGGQFIDRGENYTCAIFTDDEEERKAVAEYIDDIERRFNRKVHVKILNSQVFYKAEEYHQDYALKNPEAMEEELKNSGRLG